MNFAMFCLQKCFALDFAGNTRWQSNRLRCLSRWGAAFSFCAGVSLLRSADVADVFILAGQSNMEGRAHQRDLPESLRRTQHDVLFFSTDHWTSLAPGSSTRPASPDGFGPEISFGRTLADQWPKGRKVALIKHGPGGTSLAVDWRAPSGPQLAKMLAKVTAALAALDEQGTPYRLRAFVWVQGERDANNREDGERYEERLREFFALVRTTLHAPDLPLIVARSTPRSRPQRIAIEAVRNAQEKIVGATARAVLVDTDDLTVFEEPAPDGSIVAVHFDAPSLVKLGQRLAAATLTLAGPDKIKPASTSRPAGK